MKFYIKYICMSVALMLVIAYATIVGYTGAIIDMGQQEVWLMVYFKYIGSTITGIMFGVLFLRELYRETQND